jgi:glycosyltransferase involved in cell wall biosynthesis
VTDEHQCIKAPRSVSSGLHSLYLSYDGMCDPLGRSQVLPYLVGLTQRGHRISLISFEKPCSTENRGAVERICFEAGIDWQPLAYHKQPPILSALYDVLKMQRLAVRLHRQQPFDLLHCRSYLPALVGLSMKRRRGVPFVFDMRGFWADERVEGGLWNLSNPIFRAVYRYFKRRERDFLNEARQVVSLTEAGKEILLSRRADDTVAAPIAVIPCCVDFEAFPPVTKQSRVAARRRLGIAANARVAAYLGSIGTWYMLEEMLDFFRVQLNRESDSVFLVVTREPADSILAEAGTRGIPEDRLIVLPASREEVPQLIAAADYGLFFIKPVFSKKASSPTKMGEFLALELPIVTNGGVGDVSRILTDTGAGVAIDACNREAYSAALDQLESLRPDMARWRSAARRWFDLATGVARYDAIYRGVVEGVGANRA